MRIGRFKFGEIQFGRSVQVTSPFAPDADFENPKISWIDVEGVRYTQKVYGTDRMHWLNNVTRRVRGSEGISHGIGARVTSESGTLIESPLAFGMRCYELQPGHWIRQKVPTKIPPHYFTIFSVYARNESSVSARIILDYHAGSAEPGQPPWAGPIQIRRVSPLGQIDVSDNVPAKGGWYRFFGAIPRFHFSPNLSVRVANHNTSNTPILIDNAKLELCPIYASGRVTAVINATTFIDDTKRWIVDELKDKRIIITAGKGSIGDIGSGTRLIVSNGPNTFTLGTGVGVLELDTTSQYYITDRFVNEMEPTPYVDDWQTTLWFQNLDAVNIRSGIITVGGRSISQSVSRPRMRVLDENDEEIITIGDNISDSFRRGIRLRKGAGILVNDDGVIVAGQSVDSGPRTQVSKTGLNIWHNPTGNPDDPGFSAGQDMLRIRIGNLQNIFHPLFNEGQPLTGYGAYLSGNVYVDGQINATGDSRVQGTFSAGSPAGPSTILGSPISSNQWGLYMNTEFNQYWWVSYFDTNTQRVYWSVNDPLSNNPTDYLLRLSWRSPRAGWETDFFGPSERYFLDVNASTVVGDLVADKLRVQGVLADMVTVFGVLNSAALLIGTGDPTNLGQDLNGLYVWHGYEPWIASGREQMQKTDGFQFWASGELQGEWNHRRGAMIFGDLSESGNGLFAKDGQLLLRRTIPTFFVDRRIAWRNASHDSGAPGWYWTEFNPTVFAINNPTLGTGNWIPNTGFEPEEGSPMGRVMMGRLSPMVYDFSSSDWLEGPETRRAIWIEAFYKNQFIRNEVNSVAWGDIDGHESAIYLFGGHSVVREALISVVTHRENHRLQNFELYSQGGNPMFLVDTILGSTLYGYSDMVAISEPAAPGAYMGRLFMRLNAGKVQFCFRGPTGDVQVIASEP